MKILAINGSYRGDRGQTQHLIDLLFTGATQAGAQCETITLAKLKMNRCLGCNSCQKNARQIEDDQSDQGKWPEYKLECIFKDKDDLQSVYNKMAEADLIIYASPVYVFNISVLLKTVFDRFYGLSYAEGFRVTDAGLMFHHVNKKIVSKPFVPLIVCDNLENQTPKTLVNYFATFSKFLDAPQVGLLVRNGGALSGHGNDPEAESRMPKIQEVYKAYHLAGRELVLNGKITPQTQRKANQEIVPVPLFSLLKSIKFRPFKTEFVKAANQMRSSQMSE